MAGLDRLELLRLEAQEVVVPRAVVDEINAYDDSAADQIRKALKRWLHKRKPRNRGTVDLLLADLGPGEA
ncbi:MAG: hypothetical protein HC897_11730 [Thermoanaerobaculia bacterium]|nr:hypothetical protein [Thermoanaerobaculia bacterium]